VQGFARSGAVRWAFGLAAVPWSVVFLYGCAIAARPSSGAPSPTFSAFTLGLIIMIGALVAFLLTAVVLWFAIFVGAAVRRLLV
jgi:hypothetical protein